MIIVGITGTNGSGKGTVVEYLKQKKNFLHFSARAFLVEEIKKRKIEENRDNMVLVANELREKYGSSYIIDELFKKAKKTAKNCVIESIRTIGEVNSLREKGNFVLLAVDAKAEKRYERIKIRGSSTDMISFEKFLDDEKREMSCGDINKQNIKKCIEMADFKINNDETVEGLNKKIEEFIKYLNIDDKQ